MKIEQIDRVKSVINLRWEGIQYSIFSQQIMCHIDDMYVYEILRLWGVIMISISLCMIVKNEEEVLGQCLKSVADICDEIIIVDTGSTDRTKEIAYKYTNKVFDFKWVDHFSVARNFSFSKATKDYILWLDADDVLLEDDQEKLKSLKSQLDFSVDSVSMKYILQFDEFGHPSFHLRRNRLVKRINNFKWVGAVHEYLEVWGNIYYADIAVVHRKSDKKLDQTSDRNIKIYENRLKSGKKFSPRDLYYYANELKDHEKYRRAIKYYEKFLNTEKGWIEDRIRACLNLAECYRILGDRKKELEMLLKTFTFDTPRPEACCRIGDHFINKKEFQQAIFWYNTAIKNNLKTPKNLHNEAFSTWYPHLSLVVCYWITGKVS